MIFSLTSIRNEKSTWNLVYIYIHIFPSHELFRNTLKPLLSYFLLSYGGAAGWFIVEKGYRDRDSWLILADSSLWLVLHISYMSPH